MAADSRSFDLSFGARVNFKNFEKSSKLLRQYGGVVEHSGYKWSLILDREMRSNGMMCHDVSLKSEKIGEQDLKVQTSVEIQYRIPTSTHKTTVFDRNQKEHGIGKIPANDWELKEFVVSIKIINIQETPYFDFSVANPDLYTDVVLEVEDKDFHVCKTTLASYGTYFKSLFFEKYLESNMPKIPILDIKAADFQELLEIIYQKTEYSSKNVVGLLKVATFFQMNDIRECCERAIIRMPWSEFSPKKRIFVADEYVLTELMTRTLDSLTTVEQVHDTLPDEKQDLTPPTMKLLLAKINNVRKRPREPEVAEETRAPEVEVINEQRPRRVSPWEEVLRRRFPHLLQRP